MKLNPLRTKQVANLLPQFEFLPATMSDSGLAVRAQIPILLEGDSDRLTDFQQSGKFGWNKEFNVIPIVS